MRVTTTKTDTAASLGQKIGAVIISYIIASYVLVGGAIAFGPDAAHLELVTLVAGLFAPIVPPVLIWTFTIDGGWDLKSITAFAALVTLWMAVLWATKTWFGLHSLREIFRQ